MSSAHWFSPVRRFIFLGTAALLAFGTAHAQFAASGSSSQAPAVSAHESSSTEWVFADGGAADALPAAPEPAAHAAGQYDNKSSSGQGWLGRLAIEAGGGYVLPVGDSTSYVNDGWDVTFGGGMHFTPMLALLVEYQFIQNGLPTSLAQEAGTDTGNIHLWSFTLDPVIDLFPKSSNGVYLTGGGGFYRKVTNFQNAEAQEYCYYYYCGIGYTNATVGHFSSNQAGYNAGAGFRHRFAGMYGDGRLEVYAEARYIQAFTPAVIGKSPNGLGETTIGADTRLVPINFGIRY